MHKSFFSAVGSAPLATALAVVSLAITLLVAISAVANGRVPTDAPLGLIAALVIAAVATTEVSVPGRRNRTRRRVASLSAGADEPRNAVNAVSPRA